MSLCIVVIDRVTIPEVINNHFRVLEHRCCVDAILFPITSCFLLVDSLIGPICRHETHYVIGFFHSVDMKRNPIQLSCPCISHPHFLLGKMTLAVLPTDVFRTVSSFLDQCTRVYMTEFRQPLQVQSHLEMPGILVQLGHIQRT